MPNPRKSRSAPTRARVSLRPGRISLLYAAWAVLWIGMTGEAVRRLSLPPAIESLKGFLFVAVTAGLLYSLLSRAESKLAGFQAAARESENRFTYVVENASEGIAILAGNRFRYLNRAALSCFGATSADELVGRMLIERIQPDHRESLLEQLATLNESQTPIPLVSSRAVRIDDRVVDIELSGVPFRDGGEDGAILFFRDVSDRVRAESERQKLEAQFHQAQKLECVGQLAGGIAHDLNNHLTVINGYAELLLARLQPGDPIRGSVEEIGKAGEGSAALTSQLLAFSRKGVLNPKILDINVAVERMGNALPMLVGNDVAVATDLAPGAGYVLADETRLDQIMMNLAVNARDAMPSGGAILIRTACVEIDENYARCVPGAKAGATVRISFSDTGSGIPPEILPRIFEPFFTTKGEGRGTGLGLSTVYGIVQQFGGWISVASEAGAGTTFEIHLPRHAAESALSDSLQHRQTSPEGSETLLLVEDYHPLREFAAASLRQCGYKVLTAPNASRALKIVEEHGSSIDLLLTDVVMPGVTGRELAAKARRLCPEMKVLFISGYTGVDGAHHGMIDQFPLLTKPFTATELAMQVRAALG